MKKTTITTVLCLLGSSICAQIYQPIAFPEKVDKKYVIDPLKEQEKYMKKLKNTLSKKQAESYSVSQAFGKSELFASGGIYLSWPAMENYVNQVLDSILPSKLANKKIRAYIGRNSAINAYCLFDGTMIVNVGLLAEVKSEAALAAIMGHELGHYMKNHFTARLKKGMKKSKKPESLKDRLNSMGFSQDNELEADQQGFAIAKDANYDLGESASNFELFIREEEYYEKRSKSKLASTDSVTVSTRAGKFKANTLEKLLSTHPDIKSRQEKLNDYIKGNPQSKKTKFKMKEDLFHTLQDQARLESIALLFNGNDYQECLERAFIYHLFSPGELTFSYYIAESTRRLCLLDYRLRKKGFLTERLTSEGFNEGEGILHDPKFLVPNAERFASIKATELIAKSTTFETYRDAFAYFTKKLIDKNYQEAYLMRALFENNKGKISDNISKYLAGPAPLHKEYAMAYRDNTLTEKISANTKELVMIPRVDFYRHSVYNSKYKYGTTGFYYKRSEITGKQMANEFAGSFNGQMEDVKAISLPLAATENFNTMYKDETILNRTLLARRDENEGYEVVHYYKELEDEDYIGKIDIFRLDPDTWEFFRENGINSLTFAEYSRHKNRAAVNVIVMCIVFGPLGWMVAPFVPLNYKEMRMYSYDARLGTLYYDADVRARRLNSKKAMRMYKTMRENKQEFIKDYNSKY